MLNMPCSLPLTLKSDITQQNLIKFSRTGERFFDIGEFRFDIYSIYRMSFYARPIMDPRW